MPLNCRSVTEVSGSRDLDALDACGSKVGFVVLEVSGLQAPLAVSTNEGPHFGSPYNKDQNIFGSILGPSVYGSPHMSQDPNSLTGNHIP